MLFYHDYYRDSIGPEHNTGAGNASHHSVTVYFGYMPRLHNIIIQQIVTLSKYGHGALDICHP